MTNWLFILDIGAKILKFIKESRDVFVIYKNGGVNKAATFWKIIFSGIVIFLAFGPIIFINYQIKMVKSIEQKISTDIDRILNQCGVGSFIGWVMIEDKEVTMQELRGCINQDKNCIRGHLELDNPKAYKDIPDLDFNSYYWLKDVENGRVVTTNNLEDWRKYNTVYGVLSETNLPMDEVGFVVVKDFKHDIIYVFDLFFAKGANKNCKEPWLMLQEFGSRVKSYL